MAASEKRATPVLSDFQGQGALFDGLCRTLDEGTFVHAYLISGAEGMGKRTLARLIAQHLLCTAADVRKPCGACPACIQVQQDEHPDLITVRPGKPIAPGVRAGLVGIPVNEIRYVLSLVGQHTFEGGRRVVIIERAEKMNQPAQNALLKTLEEPLAGTVFLLLTDSPELLLPTIVSRCRALKLHPWPDEVILRVLHDRGVDSTMARKALAVSGGSIGRALTVAADDAYWQHRTEVMTDFFGLSSRSDVLRVSAAWKERKDAADEPLTHVEELLRMLLLVRFSQQDAGLLADYPAPWQRFAREGGLDAFLRLMDAVSQARRLRANNVTWQAALEQLLLSLMEEKSKWST